MLNLHRGHFDTCYAEALLQNPRLEGRTLLTVLVGANGRVASTDALGTLEGDQTIPRCIQRYAKDLSFPEGLEAKLEYPLVWVPAE